MSRTKHHKNQRVAKCFLDYGGKYKHNKHYGGGCGSQAKNAADTERRIEDKEIIKDELNEHPAAAKQVYIGCLPILTARKD